MPRRPRTDFPGAWHHVMNRGRRKEPIFVTDEDAHDFLDATADTVRRFGLELHAYALMPNHHHLLVRSRRGNISRAMRHLGAGFTQSMNRRHGWDGALFRGRFLSQLIQDPGHLLHLVAYIHLNPVAAHLVSRPDEPSWTSHRAYLGLDPTPEALTTAAMLEEFGGTAALDDFVRRVHMGSEPWPPAFNTATGWLGGQAPRFPNHQDSLATEGLEPDVVERMVCEVTGANPAELRTVVRGPRANPPRRFAVWALARETELSQSAIGERLGMSTNQVAKILARISLETPPIQGWSRAWAEQEGVRPRR